MKRFCSILLAILLFDYQSFAIDSVVSSVREYRRANERQLLQDFVRKRKQPNVASDRENIRRNAALLIEQMQNTRA